MTPTFVSFYHVSLRCEPPKRDLDFTPCKHILTVVMCPLSCQNRDSLGILTIAECCRKRIQLKIRDMGEGRNRGNYGDRAQSSCRRMKNDPFERKSAITKAGIRQADCICSTPDVLGVILGRLITCPHGRSLGLFSVYWHPSDGSVCGP
jgi:hypothetical protein